MALGKVLSLGSKVGGKNGEEDGAAHRRYQGTLGNNRHNVTLSLKPKESAKITVTLTVTCYGYAATRGRHTGRVDHTNGEEIRIRIRITSRIRRTTLGKPPDLTVRTSGVA